MKTHNKIDAGRGTADSGIEVIPAVSDGNVKVSVIMPIFNEGKYLATAMESVTGQTLREIEIICVDDGSTDNSLEILKNYQKRDERVRIVTETNAGPALARNNGLRRVRGEFMAFLDADDFFEPTMLEELYREATERELDIAIAGYDIYNTKKDSFEQVAPSEHDNIYEPGKVTSRSEYPDALLLSTNGAAWNKLFRTSFVVDKGLQFLPDVKLYEDVYFVITSLALAERIGKVFKTLLHHRVYSDQSRAKSFHKHFAQVPMIYLQIKEFLMHHGLYAPLYHSFLNLTASRCRNIFTLIDSGAREELWNLLHTEYAEKLDWTGRSAEDFESEIVFDFVANIELYDYKIYKKRCSKGLSLKLDRIAPMQKAADTKKRARSFLGKVFGKRKNKI